MLQSWTRSGIVGIVANPSSGKDVRRLSGHAGVSSNADKRSIVARALVGMAEAGVAQIRYLPDHANITASAVHLCANELVRVDVAALELGHLSATALDTTASARALQAMGCGAVLVLGGDGTNRSFAVGWRDAPVVALSTGTNNAFPQWIEPTIAGYAAGLVASGRVDIGDVGPAMPVIDITVEGERADLALVDAVLHRGNWVGARALTDPAALLAAVVTLPDPAAMGIAGLAGLAIGSTDHDPGTGSAVHLLFRPVSEDLSHTATDGSIAGPAGELRQGIRAPLAPGLYATVAIQSVATMPWGMVVTWRGPGVLALDGERERTLLAGQLVTLTVRDNGPRRIDAAAAMRRMARSTPFATSSRPRFATAAERGTTSKTGEI